MDELKRCPFCGSKVELKKSPLWYGNHGYKDSYEFTIRCKKCGCSVDQPQNDTVYRSEKVAKKNAIKAWNRRAADKQKQKMIEALKEKMAYMNTCPNERDTILRIVGGSSDCEIHCNTDCNYTECESYHFRWKEKGKVNG